MKRRALWTVLALTLLLLALLGLSVLLSPEFYGLHGMAVLSEAHERVLRELGTLAARNRDVPIAAIVLYGDSIIGKGYNTVVRDTDAGGHAEINAISNALAAVGPARFQELSRDSLVLISTLEPCPMCQGAIMEYRIRHVVFLKGRSFLHRVKQLGKQLRYEWNREKGIDEGLQDSLLQEHPDYDPTRIQW